MKELLTRCYFSGMTVKQAVEHIENGYSKKVSTRSINSAKETIKKTSGIDWN